MSNSSSPLGGALIFAFDEPTHAAGRELIQLADLRAQLSACNSGEALRVIHRSQPPVVFVCIATSCIEQSGGMIETLHQRKPRLPLLAIAVRHDSVVERTARSAGSQSYFALDTETDRRLLLRALDSIGVRRLTPSEHSPPRARDAPPIRAGP